VEDRAEVRRLHEREGLPRAAIAGRLGMSRNTVAFGEESQSPPWTRAARGQVEGGGTGCATAARPTSSGHRGCARQQGHAAKEEADQAFVKRIATQPMTGRDCSGQHSIRNGSSHHE
jgi:hypothetical protein